MGMPKAWKQQIDRSINEAANRNEENRKATQQEQNASIATPLRRLVSHFRTYNRENYAAENEKRIRDWATVIGTWTIAVATLITMAIFYCQLRVFRSSDETFKQTMISANRAWLAPRSATFMPVPTLHQPSKIIVNYGNVGKEPGRGFVADQQFGSVDAPKQNESWFSVFPKSTLKDVCVKTVASDDGLTIYPSGFSDHEYTIEGDKTDFDITSDILDGTKVAFIHGCFAYETLGEGPHKSEYCFVLVKSVDEKSGETVYRSRHCMYGNKAS